jgi:hypothetical protein
MLSDPGLIRKMGPGGDPHLEMDMQLRPKRFVDGLTRELVSFHTAASEDCSQIAMSRQFSDAVNALASLSANLR